MDKVKPNRIIAYDIMRIVAALAVIMTHCSAVLVSYHQPNTISFTVGNFFDSLSRMGVPIFLMISGALMLNENKKRTIKEMLNYSLCILVLLVVWSLIYSITFEIIIPLTQSQTVSIRNILYSAIFGHYHLWYLYVAIGLYLITPILRLFVKTENKKYITYFLVLSILIRFVVPFANFFCNLFMFEPNWISQYANSFRIVFSHECLTYYVLGWYLTTFDFKEKTKKLIYILGVVGFLITFFCSQFFTTETQKAYSVFYNNGIINILLYSVALFLFIFSFFKDKELKIKGIIYKLSNLSFGVYAIHVLVLYFAIKYTGGIEHNSFRLVVEYISTTVFSFLISYLLSKVPLLKKIIRA